MIKKYRVKNRGRTMISFQARRPDGSAGPDHALNAGDKSQDADLLEAWELDHKNIQRLMQKRILVDVEEVVVEGEVKVTPAPTPPAPPAPPVESDLSEDDS